MNFWTNMAHIASTQGLAALRFGYAIKGGRLC